MGSKIRVSQRRYRQCFYCGRDLVNFDPQNRRNKGKQVPGNASTRDHVWPRKYQHHSPFAKVITVRACFDCNNEKDDLLPHVWLVRMPENGVQRLSINLVKWGLSQDAVDNALTLRKQRKGEAKGDA
jgi:hypothetical protein